MTRRARGPPQAGCSTMEEATIVNKFGQTDNGWIFVVRGLSSFPR